MKVDVYRNLNKDCFSVRSREKEDYGKVNHYADLVVVNDVEFVVQDSGYERFEETQQKNIHAFVRGIMEESITFPAMIKKGIINDLLNATKVYYDPEYDDKFYTEHQGVIEEAQQVICYGNKIFVTKQ
jgi:hypothetical protein